jgi:hypothetical protein
VIGENFGKLQDDVWLGQGFHAASIRAHDYELMSRDITCLPLWFGWILGSRRLGDNLALQSSSSCFTEFDFVFDLGARGDFMSSI